MPDMVASYSSQRFSAMLDFQREVDLLHPSHIGRKGAEALNPLERKARGHHRAHHGDSWQQNWSDSLSTFLSSTFRAPKEAATMVALPLRPCGVEAARSYAVTRSQGQFSPQKFIRNALKRAFSRDESVMHVKRARFEDLGSTVEPMVCG